MAKDKILDHYREKLKLDEEALREYEAGRREEFEITSTGRTNLTGKTISTLKHGIAKLKAIIAAHEKMAKHG